MTYKYESGKMNSYVTLKIKAISPTQTSSFKRLSLFLITHSQVKHLSYQVIMVF